MKRIAIVGAGGFGQEVYCIWRDMLNYEQVSFEFVGFFDDNGSLTGNNFGEVVGGIDSLNSVDYPLDVAIGIGSPKILHSVRNRINNLNIKFPNIIHPSVQFLDSETTVLGEGNILSLDVIFSCNCQVGDFNIFNTRTTLGHDDVVGDFNVFSPNVQISGSVVIGNDNFWGFNSGILQGKQVGEFNTIGAGAILLRSVKDAGTYIGVPAVRMKF
ncbi:acetyltransferase [Sphingobacterium sp. xlx-130]|uniref:acetyltransferase n=1 Tax=Sphingobacterium sp. xlx-130 TaxID=2654323 RepID=UPI0013DA950A|nr:acetyltransferase [Sphingobacterium sp. xlx-130]